MSHTDRQFFTALLDKLGLPVRTSGLRACAAVAIFENQDGNLHWHNALACSLPYNGSQNLYPDMKGYVAQIYNSFDDGVTATATLFSQPHWTGVRRAIKDSYFRNPILDAFTAAYTWVDWPNESFDGFKNASFNTARQLDDRLAHILY